jgi:SAM-dependent methyltransferase
MPGKPTLYDDRFYRGHGRGTADSATALLGLLARFYRPTSVLDVGCGRGAWLAAAEELGATRLVGFEGNWVKPQDMDSPAIELRNVDLENEIPQPGEKFDLAMSLEVAEHLSAERASKFVGLLCAAADVVLFSAAIKGQLGTHHINEQRQSYWIRLFEAQGYTAIDMFRPQLWNDESVKWWYRQNAFLFVKTARHPPELNLDELRQLERPIHDIVHPASYERKVDRFENPTLLFCAETALRLGRQERRRGAAHRRHRHGRRPGRNAVCPQYQDRQQPGASRRVGPRVPVELFTSRRTGRRPMCKR